MSTVVATIADLQALTLRPLIVAAQGYSSAGDGGGGTFWWDDGSSAATVQGLVVQCSAGPSGRYVRMHSGTISPKWCGAVAGGAMDNKAAMLVALNSGFIVDGGNAKYGISGIMEPGSGFDSSQFCNATLIQLAPTTTNCRTLMLRDRTGFTLRNLSIDCGGGAQSGGSLADYAGLFIGKNALNGGSSKFLLDNITIKNGGAPISGILIADSHSFDLTDCHARDFSYSTTPSDDCMMGIGMTRCHDFSIIGGGVSNLVGTDDRVRFTRGYGTTACYNFTIDGVRVDHVDQGIDISGSEGNYNLTIGGVTLSDIASVGIKLANSCHDAVVVGCVARNCGVGGFYASGMSDPSIQPAHCAQRLTFSSCKAFNCGGDGAFQVLGNSTIDDTYPRAVLIVDCESYSDGSGTNNYGAYCTTPAVQRPTSGHTEPITNQLVNFKSTGHDLAWQTGFMFPLCIPAGNGTDSCPDSTYTSVNWDEPDIADSSGLHNPASSAETVIIKESGTYSIYGELAFTTNTVGGRVVRLQHVSAGATFNYNSNVTPAVAAAETFARINISVVAGSGDTLTLKGWQNSGGALTVNRANSKFIVTKTQ